ncbi:hypothetical protein PENANT_c020G01509 [Penicillium antarcticum]|uniref:Uncharacterized protein n=1 Tax=Penicillium antarcticum TaxID=416450 RepID=A0A1V6Q092_9EURO|nr:uncharacterized protein N7508_004347 [Penicillium antarcticum]KAJ5308968.1 hypothetical protein N7508_004347 [Penicillium antarcticum]OQD82653.1 hypothetical protein PENANT_c020G01509 [Penicillium antarcticum]
MSDNTKTFKTSPYGEREGRHPSMQDLKNRLTTDVRAKLADTTAACPGTAYVDYDGIIRDVSKHGKLYQDAENEEIIIGPDGSDTNTSRWKGWTTAHVKTTFHFEDIVE